MTNKKKADRFELLIEMPLRDMHGSQDAIAYRRELMPAQKKELKKIKKTENISIY
jgi:hypothetical protein